MPKAAVKIILLSLMLVFIGGFLLPEQRVIPVQGATTKDWSPLSFWYHPWGVSGVHKGIDIFAVEGTAVIAATNGLVLYNGTFDLGGNVVLVLGAKWRVYYYAHMRDVSVSARQWLDGGEALGTVGTTGNAQGKPPHLHFSIISLWPMLNQYDPTLPQTWKRMFYVDPDSYLKG